MSQKFVLVLVSLVLICVTCAGCASKKVIAKNCEQAANSGLFVCDPL